MLREDARSWERQTPFEQIIEPVFDWETGERRLDKVLIDDRLYGEFELDYTNPDDAVLVDLLYSEPVQRLGLIEQLILPEKFATKPETANFSRMEHSIGCMLLARKLGGDTKQQMRALLHDVAQTAFSHLGDWLKQGMDGADDHHDSMHRDFLLQFQIDDILAEYGYTVEDVSNEDIVDFVERPGPDLCVDRVDYALREFARWTAPEDVHTLIDELVVIDDMIAFKTPGAARLFGEKYLDLYFLHWAHDRHMVHEVIFFNAIKYAIETGVITEDDMYSVDPVVLTRMEMFGDEKIQEMLFLIEAPRVLRFTHIKGTADALSVGLMPTITDKLFFLQRNFRMRWVDPSYIDDISGERIRLSSVDGDFRSRVEVIRDITEWEFKSLEEKFGYEFLHYVEIDVDPETKKLLSGVGDFI
jgi:uncharacterized protein